ncbi:alanine dehydrogenase [Roseovarius dicentrarchi]|uniref:alanine dehydrogenase n=1 Tax=Roseovarius dicentrarchi TaxID=2250573 RepID=UPI000DE8162C|nr:alanine dehydrogenase [Roseovarius dicentrarchi]
MKIGCPTEIKAQEFRVGVTPNAAMEAVAHGHDVMIQSGAGLGAGFTDEDYTAAGAQIVPDAREIYDSADMVVKVKEPQEDERKMLRDGQILFAYLHLAPDPDQTHGLLESGCTAIAYETVTDGKGGLPLLAPMSEVAGRLAPQTGSWALQKANGGSGVLLGGIPGVRPGNVVILGGGVVGAAAARVAVGMGANVTVLDRSVPRLSYLDDMFMGRLVTQFSDKGAIEALLPRADLVVGAVLLAGAATPKLVSRDQLSLLQPGSVLVDVAIDQGGCFETSKATTHQNPIYEVDGIVHYCVANMPGAVARTSTIGLGNATMPHMLAIADKGWKQACKDDPNLLNGVNVSGGKLTYAAVGEALNIESVKAESLL